MADLPTPSANGKAKLPPLSTPSSTTDGSKPKKKVVKKKKKPTEEGETNVENEVPKSTPRKKKTTTTAASGSEGTESAPPKKKKKVVKKTTTDQDGDQTSARSGASQGEDVSGSKASLIKDGAPKKKKVKKKVKKTTQKDDSARDEFFDSTLAADLTEIKDDIITEEQRKQEGEDEEEEEDYRRPQYATASAALRSQPTEKFYIETGTGFKGENKNKFVKRQKEEAAEKAITMVEPKHTTLEFAIRTHKVLRTFFLFCHGILAGYAGWHIVMSYVLLNFGDRDFLEHYEAIALPVHCIFYILLAVCTVSACDRFDVAAPKRRFVIKALTLQNGTISVLLYFAALVISLSNGALEDKINLYDVKPQLWNSTSTTEEDLQTWSGLNTARNVLCVLGWFVISLTPLYDRLTSNLRETDEDELLGVDIQTTKMA